MLSSFLTGGARRHGEKTPGKQGCFLRSISSPRRGEVGRASGRVGRFCCVENRNNGRSDLPPLRA